MGSVHLPDALRRNSLFYKTKKQKAFGRGTAKENQMHGIMNSIAREKGRRDIAFFSFSSVPTLTLQPCEVQHGIVADV